MGLSTEILEKINREIEEIVIEYQEFDTKELANRFNISIEAKNGLSVLTKRLISYSGANELLNEQARENLVVKTVKLDRYGKLKESMSFPTFKYCELVNEEWKTSSLRNLFFEKTFAFTVFRNEGKQLYLNKIVLWQMPLEILDGVVSSVWKEMKECLLQGNIVKYIDDNGHYFTYFPASTSNPYVHVRPHAQNRDDTYDLPVQDKVTGLIRYPKHCFWLNRSFVLRIIEGKN